MLEVTVKVTSDSTDAASGYQSAQQPRAYPGVVGDGTGAAPIPH